MRLNTDRLDLPTGYREQVEALLREFVPEAEVWAYGSRVNGRSHEASDLDLVLRGPDLEPIPIGQMLDLEEAFERSNIPILVEARDWTRLPKSFHGEIERDYVVLRKEWRQVMLDEVIEVNPRRGLTKGNSTPFVAMADVSEHCRSLESIKYRKYQGGGARFCDGDTLLARITPCLENGKTAWVNNLPKDITAHGSTEFIVLSARSGMTDPLFVYYLARSPTFRAYAIDQMTGTSGRQRVPTEAVKSYRFGLPPLEEQRQIAHILGALDDKIELNRRMCETLEETTRSLFRSWFVNFDPVRAKMKGRWQRGESLPGLPAELYDLFPNRLVPSELGPIPEGWKVSPVGCVTKVYGGTTPSTKESSYWNGQHCFATPKDMSTLHTPLLMTTNRKVTDLGLAKIQSGLLPTQTLLMSSRAPIGYLAITEIPVTVNQGIIAIVCDQMIGSIYVLHWVEAHLEAIKAWASGTTFAEISKSSFRSIPFLVPTQATHVAYENLASPLYRSMAKLVKQSRALSSLRDNLLPRLMSGEVRMSGAEALVA